MTQNDKLLLNSNKLCPLSNAKMHKQEYRLEFCDIQLWLLQMEKWLIMLYIRQCLFVKAIYIHKHMNISNSPNIFTMFKLNNIA